MPQNQGLPLKDVAALWPQQPCACYCPWPQMPCYAVDLASAYRRTLRTEGMLPPQGRVPLPLLKGVHPPPLPLPSPPCAPLLLPPHKAMEHINPTAVSILYALPPLSPQHPHHTKQWNASTLQQYLSCILSLVGGCSACLGQGCIQG